MNFATEGTRSVDATRAELGLPPARPNGGWFSGKTSSTPNAPWATVPTVPDAGFATYATLTSAGPPPGAQQQYAPAGVRPGNNRPVMVGISVDGEKDLYLDGMCYDMRGTGTPSSRAAAAADLPGWDPDASASYSPYRRRIDATI